MAQGGISTISMTAVNAEDPQTLWMIDGAIANFCGAIIIMISFLLVPFNLALFLIDAILPPRTFNC